MTQAFTPAVFPLHLIVQTPEGPRCGCGDTACTRIGKHPDGNWGDLQPGELRRSRHHPNAGYGIATGALSSIVVVDLDGPEALREWLRLGGSGPTYTVKTGRVEGGWQLYFQHPGFPHHNTIASKGGLWWNGKKAPESQGIDTRGDGGYVVMAGSPHRSGAIYTVVDNAPVAPLPAWLLAWMQARPAKPTETQVYPGDVAVGTPEHAYHRKLYTEYLRNEAPPCIQGQGGDTNLYPVVQRGAYDLALPVDDVLALVREHYDPRCDPPWGDELEKVVVYKAEYAKENSKREQLIPIPEDLAHLAKTNEDRQQDFAAALEAISEATRKEDNQSESLNTSAIADATKPDALGLIWGGWDQPVLPPVYMLEGIIPEATVFTFFAEGGSLKTWAALSLAIAVATGEPWLGMYPVKQGRVVYLDYEDGRYEFTRRVRMLTGGREIPNLGYLYGGPRLHKQDIWLELAKMDLRLVLVDSLGAGMPANVDENLPIFAEGVKLAGTFSTRAHCNVGFIHHANKQGGMRGTTTVRDQSDVVFKFEPVSETDAVKRMRMVCDKPGPQKRPKPVNVELSDAGLRLFEDEVSDISRNAANPKDLKAAVLLALESGPMVVPTLCERLGTKNNRGVADALKALAAVGDVVHVGKFVGWQLDDDQKRFARILAAAPESTGTTAQLADAANVPTEYVDKAREAKLIDYRTGREGNGFTVRGSGTR